MELVQPLSSHFVASLTVSELPALVVVHLARCLTPEAVDAYSELRRVEVASDEKMPHLAVLEAIGANLLMVLGFGLVRRL